MAIIGYARVSSRGQRIKGNSLEDQERILRENGSEKVYRETYTGMTTERPVFTDVLKKLQEGDTLQIIKLDRLCRTAGEGINLIQDLTAKGIKVHILNMGIADSTPMGKLMVTILSGFAEFERDMIVERTQSGKAIARTKEGFKDGRPKKYTEMQIKMALDLLETHSYTEVEKMTRISKATLVRERRKLAALSTQELIGSKQGDPDTNETI